MIDYRMTLKKAIKRKFGTIEKWAAEHNVSTERFYNFLKGTHNPRIETVEKWISTVDLQFHLKKSSKKK